MTETAPSDARLALRVQRFALLVADVLGGGTRHAHAAVKAREQSLVGQPLHVAPHRLQRDAQHVGQLLDGDRAARAHGIEKVDLARIGIHKNVVENGKTLWRVQAAPL